MGGDDDCSTSSPPRAGWGIGSMRRDTAKPLLHDALRDVVVPAEAAPQPRDGHHHDIAEHVAVSVTSPPPRRRVIAVGKKTNGRWQVRTSLWRYLTATALSQ